MTLSRYKDCLFSLFSLIFLLITRLASHFYVYRGDWKEQKWAVSKEVTRVWEEGEERGEFQVQAYSPLGFFSFSCTSVVSFFPFLLSVSSHRLHSATSICLLWNCVKISGRSSPFGTLESAFLSSSHDNRSPIAASISQTGRGWTNEREREESRLHDKEEWEST